MSMWSSTTIRWSRYPSFAWCSSSCHRWITTILPPGPSQLIWDANFNTTFGPLHEDYRSRAQLIERAPGSPVIVWLPAAEDLALSKLGRFEEVDQNDILDLLSQPGSSWELFESLAREASGYYVGPPLDAKIAYIQKRLEKRRKKP